MSEAGSTFYFISRANIVINRYCHNRGRVVFRENDTQTVLQLKLSELHAKGLRRRKAHACDEGDQERSTQNSFHN